MSERRRALRQRCEKTPKCHYVLEKDVVGNVLFFGMALEMLRIIDNNGYFQTLDAND